MNQLKKTIKRRKLKQWEMYRIHSNIKPVHFFFWAGCLFSNIKGIMYDSLRFHGEEALNFQKFSSFHMNVKYIDPIIYPVNIKSWRAILLSKSTILCSNREPSGIPDKYSARRRCAMYTSLHCRPRATVVTLKCYDSCFDLTAALGWLNAPGTHR